MAVAGADNEVFAFHLGAVTHADDLKLFGETGTDAFDHVGHQGAAKAVTLP
jgi:hypothetical protein